MSIRLRVPIKGSLQVIFGKADKQKSIVVWCQKSILDNHMILFQISGTDHISRDFEISQ